jgi:hypothetical protein
MGLIEYDSLIVGKEALALGLTANGQIGCEESVVHYD